jgi:protein O-mannosyl-transferase
MSESAAIDPSPRAQPAPPTHPSVGWAAALIFSVGAAAYSNSLHGAFFVDDRGCILLNPTIRSFWTAWWPPANGDPTAGRPLVNLSLAFNYFVSGFQVWSYHLLNLIIHLLAALTLLGVVRRTLASPKLPPRCGARAWPLALATTVLWTVHPLQTESVAFVSQRAESLMGLFYLLTLYGLARAVEVRTGRCWLVVSAAACLLGMFCKEVMVTAPLLALLYDRTFVTGTFAETWRQRWKYYVALAATWIPLAGLVWAAGNRGGSAGFHAGVAWQDYAWSQFPVIAHYLSLSGWPHPLTLDYGVTLAQSLGAVVPAAGLILALAAGTIYLLWRRSAWGFLGAWFFIVLAPSSSVIPIVTEIAAEHRMYLPLAALALLVVLGLDACLQPRLFAAAIAVWAMALGSLTFERNEDYQTELVNYQAMVAAMPENARAHQNLGVNLAAAGRLRESAQESRNALRINPRMAEAEHNLGFVLAQLGQPDQAILHYRNALRIFPDSIPDHTALGSLLASTGQLADATTEFATVVRLQPDSAEAHLNLGNVLAPAQKFPEAAAQFSLALKIQPDFVAAHCNLAFCLMQMKQYDAAVRECEVAERLDPANPIVLNTLKQARQLQNQATPPP